MTRDELIDVVTEEVKGLSTKLADADYENAVSDALRDTGWVLPTTDDFQILWIKRRTKRHLFFMLWTESASKFKFEQINSQMKFDHYRELVKSEDEDFEKVMKSESYRFASVPAHTMFGSKIDAGFAYDRTGNDLTYTTGNKVVISPSSEES